MKLIDADALDIFRVEEDGIHQWREIANQMVSDIQSLAPVVDAAPVVHGRWVDHGVRDWRCSECGEKIQKVRKIDGYCYNDKPKYCPDCGAKMDKED